MGTGKSPPLLELGLKADPKAVPTARRQVMEVCMNAGLTDDDCFMLDLALGEALANAVTHAAPSATHAGENHVFLSLWDYQGLLIIQVQDRGQGFEPPSPPYPMPNAMHEETHGRGLPLMETLTDAMIICRGCIREGGSSVYLLKRMPR